MILNFMSIEQIPNSEEDSLKKQWDQLPNEVQKILPKENFEYYESTNRMHCDESAPGGSKFLKIDEGGVDNIFQVIEKLGYDRFSELIKSRTDHRDELMEAGAPENAFLPAVKTDNMPEGLPEALYFKVDNIKGRLGIIQIAQLNPQLKIKVMQEKEGAPLSYSVVLEDSKDAYPETDFATIIIGRDPGSDKDELWTIHPGAPIRPVTSDKFKDGDEITVQDLIDSGVSTDEYIKIY